MAVAADLEVDHLFQTTVDYAATDEPLIVEELTRTFRGKLPIWLDLDGGHSPLLWRRRRYRRILAGATVVTVATRGCWEEVRESTHRVHLVPDPLAGDPPAEPPDSLLPPALGFAGETGKWFLPHIPVELAEQRRDWQVYLAGEAARLPVFQAAERNLPNLHLAPEANSDFWRRLQVAVLPFAVDHSNENWLPGACLQAWVHSVPAVATPLAEVARLDAPTLFATDTTAFIRQTQLLLDEPQNAARQATAARGFVLREHDPATVAERLRRALTGATVG